MQDRELNSNMERIARANKLETDQLMQTHKLESAQEKHSLELEAKQKMNEIERKKADAAAELMVSLLFDARNNHLYI